MDPRDFEVGLEGDNAVSKDLYGVSSPLNIVGSLCVLWDLIQRCIYSGKSWRSHNTDSIWIDSRLKEEVSLILRIFISANRSWKKATEWIFCKKESGKLIGGSREMAV